MEVNQLWNITCQFNSWMDRFDIVDFVLQLLLYKHIEDTVVPNLIGPKYSLKELAKKVDDS